MCVSKPAFVKSGHNLCSICIHDAETQTTRKVYSDVGIQCELVLPPAIATSTPTKAGVGVSEPIISDISISTSDDDDNDDVYEGSTVVQSTLKRPVYLNLS